MISLLGIINQWSFYFFSFVSEHCNIFSGLPAFLLLNLNDFQQAQENEDLCAANELVVKERKTQH